MKAIEIKKIRKTHGLLQKELGQMLGVEQEVISSWESGKNRISPAYIRILQNLFKKVKVVVHQNDMDKIVGSILLEAPSFTKSSSVPLQGDDVELTVLCNADTALWVVCKLANLGYSDIEVK